MVDTKTLLVSLFGGTGITLITGLIPRKALIGATHYGWPMAWLIRLVLAPQHNPWRVSPVWLVADVTLWGLVVYLLVSYMRKSGKRAP